MRVTHTVKKDTVSMTKRSFDALMEYIEDMEDVVAFDRGMMLNEEAFPLEICKRLRDENPILVYREYRGLTQAQLAKKVGLSKSMISNLENGVKVGSIESLKAIAKTLKVDLDDLV